MEMVHSSEFVFTFDYWTNNNDCDIELNCLMPNGVFIPLSVNKTSTFEEIKEDLWEESGCKFPLHGLLHDSSSYRFKFININAELEEVFDENKRLCDVKPFGATVRIIEKQNDKAENAFNVQIGRLIGKRLHEFDMLKNIEVNIFRSKMKFLAEDIACSRKTFTWLEKMRYQFPPTLIFTPLEKQLQSEDSPLPKIIRDGNFVVVIKFESNDSTFTFNVPLTSTSNYLLQLVLNKRATNFLMKNEVISDFVLKVCGREEFIYGDGPLIEYAYIYESLRQLKTPTLVVISVHNVPLHPEEHLYEVPEELESSRRNSSFSSVTLRKRSKYISSYHIEEKFGFKVCFITNLNVHSTEIGVQAGLFHGGKALCEPKSVPERIVKDGRCVYESDVLFDIQVGDIPRMARICFIVYEMCKVKNTKAKKPRDNQESFISQLGWVSTTVFDYKGYLGSGSVTLYLWMLSEELPGDTLQSLSLNTVGSNPDIKNTATLSISFNKFHEDIIIYPDIDSIVEFAAKYGKADLRDRNEHELQSAGALLLHIKTISDQVTRYDMHEQERKILWSLRYNLMKHEKDFKLLSKLLNCVDWNNRFEVSEAISILQRWPQLPPQKALELLDCAYADQAVRNYAVSCLRNLEDDHLSLYLLQLVQALKHECYLQNELLEFLLRKALDNQKIGHYLFWHLRSEMKVAQISVRFGLILEAYCRGSPEHVKILSKQMDFMEKLRMSNTQIRKRKDKDKIRSFVQEYFREAHCAEKFFLVCNPLDPSYKTKRIKVERCRVMDSKAKPLWLVFENADMFGDDIHIIFKNGDDLRQDMLTLQMIRIIDNIWKEEGLDFRMSPYGCVSTDSRVGLIEVVRNAETIANIQKEKGFSSAMNAVFKKGCLLAWLKEHNPTEQALEKAHEEFLYSCAGYCVATFVLGIADRHSDNIMVKKTGQLFHIDFGHILGHYKEKFGVRRERVPFVLVHDFVHVITRGQDQAKSEHFEKFQKLCTKAFTILRDHGSLILSLFAMMISTGLPELSSENDLNYLHESLVLHKTRDQAEAYFVMKFQDAIKNSWKTSMNWATHNLSKNNRAMK